MLKPEMKCWTFEDQEHANYSVVYLMNDAGEKNLYSYESTEGTLQKYVPSIEKNEMGMITYIFIGTSGSICCNFNRASSFIYEF